MKTYNIIVARFIDSEFDSENNVFRRKLIGADGMGYQFVRPVSVDRENLLMESAVVHDLKHWLESEERAQSRVVSLAPKYKSNKPKEWLPEICINRPTRHFWLADRRQIQSRVKASDNNTYNVFTPICFLEKLLLAFDSSEASIREQAYGEMPNSYDQDSEWLQNPAGPH